MTSTGNQQPLVGVVTVNGSISTVRRNKYLTFGLAYNYKKGEWLDFRSDLFSTCFVYFLINKQHQNSFETLAQGRRCWVARPPDEYIFKVLFSLSKESVYLLSSEPPSLLASVDNEPLSLSLSLSLCMAILYFCWCLFLWPSLPTELFLFVWTARDSQTDTKRKNNTDLVARCVWTPPVQILLLYMDQVRDSVHQAVLYIRDQLYVYTECSLSVSLFGVEM